MMTMFVVLDVKNAHPYRRAYFPVFPQVERLHYMERHGNNRRASFPHMQASVQFLCLSLWVCLREHDQRRETIHVLSEVHRSCGGGSLLLDGQICMQAGSTGAKRKVTLARMVFGNAKRLKWIEERLLCASTRQSSPMAANATLEPAPASSANISPSPALQCPLQPTAGLQEGLNTAGTVPQPALQQAPMDHVDTGAQRTDPPLPALMPVASPQPCLASATPAVNTHLTSTGTGPLPY